MEDHAIPPSVSDHQSSCFRSRCLHVDSKTIGETHDFMLRLCHISTVECRGEYENPAYTFAIFDDDAGWTIQSYSPMPAYNARIFFGSARTSALTKTAGTAPDMDYNPQTDDRVRGLVGEGSYVRFSQFIIDSIPFIQSLHTARTVMNNGQEVFCHPLAL